MKFFINLGIAIAIFAAAAVLMLMPWWLWLAAMIALVLWIALTRRGAQTWSVARVGLATIPQRLPSASVVVVGIAGVVAVLVALLAMGDGFRSTLNETGDDVSAIIMRAGANTELNSVLLRDAITTVLQKPGIAKDAQGQPIASAELVVIASLPKKATGTDANVEVRGVGAHVWELRPQVKIIAGRKFNPGLRELVAGKGARTQFAKLDLGSTLMLNNQTWTVVGEFESGDSFDSELWGDEDVVASTYRRGNSASSLTVKLTEPAALDQLKAALASDPSLTVEAKTTRDYFSAQSETLTRLVTILGTAIAAIMAIGAIFGALNTMYAAVAARAREIATLRAIGFRGVPVVVSVLIETMLLALLGGALGAAIAWLIFNNYTVSTLGSNFSQVVFAFKVSPDLVWKGLKWALAIGFVGGVFPALRAARLPVTTALREQ